MKRVVTSPGSEPSTQYDGGSDVAEAAEARFIGARLTAVQMFWILR